jgi:hypothetical protein
VSGMAIPVLQQKSPELGLLAMTDGLPAVEVSIAFSSQFSDRPGGRRLDVGGRTSERAAFGSEAGRRRLDVGGWTSEAGRRRLEVGRWTSDAGGRSGPRSDRRSDAERRTLDVGRWTPELTSRCCGSHQPVRQPIANQHHQHKTQNRRVEAGQIHQCRAGAQTHHTPAHTK